MFLGYSTFGLAGVIDDKSEEEKAAKVKRDNLAAASKRPPRKTRKFKCPVCKERVETTHNSQVTCLKQKCQREHRNKKQRRYRSACISA